MLLLTCPVSDPRQWRLWRLPWASRSPHPDGPPCPSSPARRELTSAALLAPLCGRKGSARAHTEQDENDSDGYKRRRNFSSPTDGPPLGADCSSGYLPASPFSHACLESYLVTWLWPRPKEEKQIHRVLEADLWICFSTVLNLLKILNFLNNKHLNWFLVSHLPSHTLRWNLKEGFSAHPLRIDSRNWALDGSW